VVKRLYGIRSAVVRQAPLRKLVERRLRNGLWAGTPVRVW
jgi:hypothetical protein